MSWVLTSTSLPRASPKLGIVGSTPYQFLFQFSAFYTHQFNFQNAHILLRFVEKTVLGLDAVPPMPRIPTSIIIQAHRQDPLLPILLQECRSLHCAQNELRWLRERALYNARQRSSGQRATSERKTSGWRSWLRSMCRERAKGKPLQYILGDQPFGDLEILCRRGVLIPRFVAHSAMLKISARSVADCT